MKSKPNKFGLKSARGVRGNVMERLKRARFERAARGLPIESENDRSPIWRALRLMMRIDRMREVKRGMSRFPAIPEFKKAAGV